MFDDLSLPEEWQPLNDVPRTRADCPTTRPCPHIKCRMHLWLIEPEAMPGRRWERAAPEAGFHPWSNTTCALDVAEQQTQVEDVARYLGMSARQVRRIVEGARRKLARNPDAAEVLRNIAEAGADQERKQR